MPANSQFIENVIKVCHAVINVLTFVCNLVEKGLNK